MDDALLMGGGQRFGDRGDEVQDSIDGETTVRNQPTERLALDELHREEVDAVGFLKRMDRDDVADG